MNEDLNLSVMDVMEVTESVSKTESPIAAFNNLKKPNIKIDPVHIDFS